MNQEQFIRYNEACWQTLERVLQGKPQRKAGVKPTQTAPPADQAEAPPAPDPGDYPHLYRQVCHHLALARSRRYSRPLIERLSNLALRGHQRFYHSRVGVFNRMLHFAGAGFPRLVRQQWRLVALSSLLLYGPMLAFLIAIQYQPDLVYTVLDGPTVREMEAMYDPALRDRLGRERESDTDVAMWGFYIINNVSIGFRMFAGGLFLGLGSLFFLLFNGVYIGAISGHLTRLGYIETFWGFVAGHSALELTGFVLCGAAGLKIGLALISPGRKSRMRALRDSAITSVHIVYGAATMIFMAAFVEAFWSSIAWMPINIKYGVGIGMWTLLLAYFLLLGRGREA